MHYLSKWRLKMYRPRFDVQQLPHYQSSLARRTQNRFRNYDTHFVTPIQPKMQWKLTSKPWTAELFPPHFNTLKYGSWYRYSLSRCNTLRVLVHGPWSFLSTMHDSYQLSSPYHWPDPALQADALIPLIRKGTSWELISVSVQQLLKFNFGLMINMLMGTINLSISQLTA
jgi:hypothetical protein